MWSLPETLPEIGTSRLVWLKSFVIEMCNCRQIIPQWLQPIVGKLNVVRQRERKKERRTQNGVILLEPNMTLMIVCFIELLNRTQVPDAISPVNEIVFVASPKTDPSFCQITNAHQQSRRQTEKKSSLYASTRMLSFPFHSQTDLIQKWPLYCDSRLS